MIYFTNSPESEVLYVRLSVTSGHSSKEWAVVDRVTVETTKGSFV